MYPALRLKHSTVLPGTFYIHPTDIPTHLNYTEYKMYLEFNWKVRNGSANLTALFSLTWTVYFKIAGDHYY